MTFGCLPSHDGQAASDAFGEATVYAAHIRKALGSEEPRGERRSMAAPTMDEHPGAAFLTRGRPAGHFPGQGRAGSPEGEA